MQVSLELAGYPKANVKQVVLGTNTVIGRSKDCQLRIASAGVSRKHCEIRIFTATATVVDLGSSNGTFIDDQRLPAGEEHSLENGARLAIGSVRFVVRFALSPQPGSTIEYRGAASDAASAGQTISAQHDEDLLESELDSTPDLPQTAELQNSDQPSADRALASELFDDSASAGDATVFDGPSGDEPLLVEEEFLVEDEQLSDKNRAEDEPIFELEDEFEDSETSDSQTAEAEDDAFDFLSGPADDDPAIEADGDLNNFLRQLGGEK